MTTPSEQLYFSTPTIHNLLLPSSPCEARGTDGPVGGPVLASSPEELEHRLYPEVQAEGWLSSPHYPGVDQAQGKASIYRTFHRGP